MSNIEEAKVLPKLLLLMAVVITAILLNVSEISSETEEIEKENAMLDDCIVFKQEKDTETEEELDVVYYDIPLDEELQDYIREVSESYNIDMELVLAIMKTESEFKHQAKSKNNVGGGHSEGIMQLNTASRNYINWYKEITDIEDFDPKNIHHNIEGGIAVYKDYEDQWIKSGYDGDRLVKITLLSYNRGVTGARKYIERYGLSNSYVNKVLKAKEEVASLKINNKKTIDL